MDPALYHWRSYGGAEVDLIIEREGIFHLIEIKLTARPSLKNLRGIKAFQETYPELKIGSQIIISGGREVSLLDEKTIVVPITMV